MIRICLVVMTLLATGALAFVGYAQDKAAFADPARVAAYINNDSRAFVAMLEGVLTQRQCDDIEVALFPPPTDTEKRKALERAVLALRDAGLKGNSAAVIEIVKELDAMPVDVTDAGEKGNP
jgi:hypothetical protein